VTAGGGPIRSCAHDDVNDHCPYPRPGTRAVRACALVSGVVGHVAALLLLGDYVVDNLYDANPGGRTWMARGNDVLGIVQFAAFASVA